jgi:hypothetical protein
MSWREIPSAVNRAGNLLPQHSTFILDANPESADGSEKPQYIVCTQAAPTQTQQTD